MTTPVVRKKLHPLLTSLVLIAIGIALNLVLNKLAALIGLPLYLDTVGTVFVAVVGGNLPGVLAGFLTNVLLSLTGGDEICFQRNFQFPGDERPDLLSI